MNSNKMMLNAQDVMTILQISRTSAYKLIKECNKELSRRGYITFPGKIPREYLETKIYHRQGGE